MTRELVTKHYNKAVAKRPEPEKGDGLFQTPDADRFYHFYTKGPEAYKAINRDERGQETHSLGWSKEDGLRWISAELEASPRLRRVPEVDPHPEFAELVDTVLGLRGVSDGEILRDFREATGKTGVMADRFLFCLRSGGAEGAAESELLDKGATKLDGKIFFDHANRIFTWFNKITDHPDLQKYKRFAPEKPDGWKPVDIGKMQTSKKKYRYKPQDQSQKELKKDKVEEKKPKTLKELSEELRYTFVQKAGLFIKMKPANVSESKLVEDVKDVIVGREFEENHARNLAREALKEARKPPKKKKG